MERLGIRNAFTFDHHFAQYGTTMLIPDLFWGLDPDAPEMAAFYAQQAPPTSAEEAAILVVQADGKGVPRAVVARSLTVWESAEVIL
jgi:hypothetical protein